MAAGAFQIWGCRRGVGEGDLGRAERGGRRRDFCVGYSSFAAAVSGISQRSVGRPRTDLVSSVTPAKDDT
jgi:hypothetical protein